MSLDDKAGLTNEILREEPPRNHTGSWIRIVLAQGDSLELPIHIWMQSGYKVGTTLSPFAEEDLRAAQQLAEGIEMGLGYLDRKPCTTKEMRVYLKRKKMDEETANRVVQALQDKGWLDDLAYAQRFVTLMSSRWSRRELAWKLIQRGVSRELIEEALTTEDSEGEYAAALRAAQKFWKRGTAVDWELRRKKMMHYLERRGFDSSSIHFALDRVAGETNE